MTQERFVLDPAKGFYCLRTPEHQVEAKGDSHCLGGGKGRPQVILWKFLNVPACFMVSVSLMFIY